MLNFFRKLSADYKEYILLIVLAVISLTILSKNEKPEVKHIRTFALGYFSILHELTSSVISVWDKGPSKAELIKENAKLMLEVNRMRKMRSDNEELRAMIAFKDTSRYPLIPAKVISKLVTQIHGNYIINRGFRDEVQKGMPVLSEKGLVGLITDVADNYSVVRILHNSDLNIAVTLLRTNVNGILNYDGRNLLIKDIPTTYDVQLGDRVETSDFSSLFPPSIPVGVVVKKESNVLGLLHSITITPFADIAGASNIFILKVIPSKQINDLEMNLLKQN